MNSCRSSSHFCPAAVRKFTPASHSCLVSRVSIANACRWLIRLVRSWRKRGSGVLA